MNEYNIQGGPKRVPTLLSITSPNATGFRNSFIAGIASQFPIKSILNIPPHLTNVATLPCGTLMSENSDNLKYYGD